MILDEAIEREENIAEANQRVIDTGIVFNDVSLDTLYCGDTEVIAEHLANYHRCAEEHRQIAEWLKELKQLKEQTRWIPVSERLPQSCGIYNVTRKIYDSSGTAPIFISDVSYFDGQNIWYNDNRINHARGFLYDVIAWSKPLPDPYEEE